MVTRAIVLSSLIVMVIVVITQQQAKALSNEQLTDRVAAKIVKDIKDTLNNKIIPLFVQKCKAELGIPQDQAMNVKVSELKCYNAIEEFKNGDIAIEVASKEENKK